MPVRTLSRADRTEPRCASLSLSLLESCSLWSGMALDICLIAVCAYAVQFLLAPLMLFNKSSQNRTKWKARQFHMKRGGQNPGEGSC